MATEALLKGSFSSLNKSNDFAMLLDWNQSVTVVAIAVTSSSMKHFSFVSLVFIVFSMNHLGHFSGDYAVTRKNE